MVVLGLFGYVTDENGKEKCIPVTVNHWRNSHFGIKPLKYKVCTTDVSNYTFLLDFL